jgi:hypothetical protein
LLQGVIGGRVVVGEDGSLEMNCVAGERNVDFVEGERA